MKKTKLYKKQALQQLKKDKNKYNEYRLNHWKLMNIIKN